MSFIPPSYNINKNLSNYFDTDINGFNLNTEPFYNSFDFYNNKFGLFGFNDFTSSCTSINPVIFSNFGSYPSMDTLAFTSMPNFTNQASYMPWNNNYSPRIDITNLFTVPSWDTVNTQFNNYLNNFRFNNISFSNTPTVQTTSNQTSNSTLTASGNKIADGTPLTINGIDYSIFGSEDSKIKRLRPQMQLNMKKLFEFAKEKGWKISITGGFRSTERQRELYNTPGVYAAEPGTSRHEFGCAVDLRVNGSSRNKETKELGRYALSLDMRWGGTWSGNKYEPWHFDINPKTTPTGTEYVAVNQSSSNPKINSNLALTTNAELKNLYNGNFSGSYVNTGKVVHFKYDDAKMRTGELKQNAQNAFNRMKAAMQKDLGFTLGYSSGYRSSADQKASLNNHTYNSNPEIMKKRFESVAPIGYSEHHTGYACDITVDGKRDRTAATWYNNAKNKKVYDWLKANAKKYGFEQSFPKGNKQGVVEEPWHWRFVGDEASRKVFADARAYQGYTTA